MLALILGCDSMSKVLVYLSNFFPFALCLLASCKPDSLTHHISCAYIMYHTCLEYLILCSNCNPNLYVILPGASFFGPGTGCR